MKRIAVISLAVAAVAAGAGAAALTSGGAAAAGASSSVRTGASTGASTGGASGTATLTAATAAQTISTESTKRCDAHGWADRVEGRPAGFDAHDKGGDYLWHDKDGFHLRATHRGDDRHVYSGSITASTQIVDLDRSHLEKGDKVWLSADHKTLNFQFSDYGWIDGADFRTACATTLTVANLKTGTSPLPASRVYLGHTKAHPARVPFTLHRES